MNNDNVAVSKLHQHLEQKNKHKVFLNQVLSSDIPIEDISVNQLGVVYDEVISPLVRLIKKLNPNLSSQEILEKVR